MQKPEPSGGGPVMHGLKIESIALAAFAATTTCETIATGRTFFPRAGDVHQDLAALEFLIVELLDGFLRFLGGGVFHEGKTAGTAGHFIEHEVDRGYRARLGEVLLQVVFPRLKRQVADE